MMDEKDLQKTEETEASTIFDAPRQIQAKEKKSSTKTKKTWMIILLIITAAALLSIAIYGVNNWIPSKEDTSSTESETNTLDPIVSKSENGSTDCIKAMSILNTEDSFNLVRNKEGIMVVEGYEDLPNATSSIDNILSYFVQVTPKSVIFEKATAEQLKACGLDNATYKAKVTYTDGDTITFCFGNLEAGDSNGYYLCLEGQNTVYLVNVELCQSIGCTSLSLLSSSMITAPSNASDDTTGVAKVLKMRLSGSIRDEAIALRYIDDTDSQSYRMAGNMVITEPYYRAIDTKQTQEWDTSLVALTALDTIKAHPTAEDLAKYGLDTPHSVGEFTVGIRKSTDESGNDLDEVKIYNQATYTVSLGDTDEDGNYYAMVNGIDIVYTVSASTVPWAECKYEDLVSDILFLRNITDISDIHIVLNGKEHTIHLKHEKKETSDGTSTVEELTATIGSKTCDTDAVRNLYSSMMMIQRLESLEEGTTISGSPALRLYLTSVDKDNAEKTDVSFYPLNANRYICVVEDGDTYQVKASDIESFITKVNDLIK
ncbi:MAG: DUF4340 domain-containing protein [Clostridia bacterium]|nr:DUF4340 domain-containing protein [Clostridia bacterium]